MTDFVTQISKKGEVLGKDVFPATEFGVGLFPSFSRLRAASKRGSKDDDEPDAFWFFQDGKIIMQGSHLELFHSVARFLSQSGFCIATFKTQVPMESSIP